MFIKFLYDFMFIKILIAIWNYYTFSNSRKPFNINQFEFPHVCFCVYMCTCSCMWWCMCPYVYLHVWRPKAIVLQALTTMVLRLQYSCSLPICELGWQSSPHLCLLTFGITMWCSASGLFVWSCGVDLIPSCLAGKYFTDLAISQALNVLLRTA